MVAKEAKKRREAATAYTDAARPELADKEEAELAVLEAYLPAQLADDELEALVAQAVRVHRCQRDAADGPGHEGRPAAGGRPRRGRPGGRSREEGPRRLRRVLRRAVTSSAPTLVRAGALARAGPSRVRACSGLRPGPGLVLPSFFFCR